jgi:membrane-associated phospholipid phosphatase
MSETGEFMLQPLKWRGDDYLTIGAIGVGGGLSMFADQPIRDAAQREHAYFYSVPIVFGRMYGELYSPIIIFSGFAIYSVIADDIKARKIAFEIGQASLYAGGIVYVMKVALGRARPIMYSGTQGAGFYRPFSTLLDDNWHSMPSGHSAAAFTISTVLARNVNPYWLKVLFYVPAVLTMTSRVYQNLHWTSDDLVSAAIGYYIGTWVVDRHERPSDSETKATQQGLLQRIEVQPFMMGDMYGLNLNLKL